MMIFGIVAIGTYADAGIISGKVNLKETGYSETIVVYLEDVNGNFKTPKNRPQMDHKDQSFVPRTLVVMKGTIVDFSNSDQVFHSAFSISESNPFDLGIYGPGRDKNVTFKNSGLVEIFCHIHEHMYGFVLVLDHPFFSTVKEDGSFAIRGVPNGAYRVKAWMPPRVNETKSVTLHGNETVSLDFLLTTKKLVNNR